MRDAQRKPTEAIAGLREAIERYQSLSQYSDSFTAEELKKQRSGEANALFGALSLANRQHRCAGGEDEAECRAEYAAWMERLQHLCRLNDGPPLCQRMLEDLTAIETLLTAPRQETGGSADRNPE
jgi:hypothetical protein